MWERLSASRCLRDGRNRCCVRTSDSLCLHFSRPLQKEKWRGVLRFIRRKHKTPREHMADSFKREEVVRSRLHASEGATGASGTVKEDGRRARSFFGNALAALLLAAVLCAAAMSWRSSRTLAYSLGGSWTSADGETFTASCSGDATWSSTCALKSADLRFAGVVLASPLSAGGWVAMVRSDDGDTVFLHHRRETLTAVSRSAADVVRTREYTRSTAQAEDFLTVLRLKGKYIGALFVLVGSYKWVQVAFFGAPLRRARRF